MNRKMLLLHWLCSIISLAYGEEERPKIWAPFFSKGFENRLFQDKPRTYSCLSEEKGFSGVSIQKNIQALDLSKPYVSCILAGQLGNQLFQIASTLAYAWDHQLHPLFPDLLRDDFNIPANREKIFYRLDTSPLPREPSNTFYFDVPFQKVDIPYIPDLQLNGLFQSSEFFHHYREELLKIFAPRPQELTSIKLKYDRLLKHPLTVGIHVRTFNQSWHDTGIPFVGLDYYAKAMDHFPKETVFVVFSDRINWCKHHFKQFDRPIVYIEDQDHVSDLFLMSMLKHNIIGNSSFSWWAAYFNQNPDKTIIAPFHFVRPRVVTKYGSAPNANRPEWTVLDIDLEAAYPDDMLEHDSQSTSIDTQ